MQKKINAFSCKPCKIPSRSVSDRPNRSTDQAATMSNLFALTALIIESSPGRLSLPLAPEMPASSYTDNVPAESFRHRLQFSALIVGVLLSGTDSEINGDAFHRSALPTRRLYPGVETPTKPRAHTVPGSMGFRYSRGTSSNWRIDGRLAYAVTRNRVST